MPADAPEWLAPESLDEALRLRAERPELTVVAGGTFVGLLVNQRLLEPVGFLSLERVPGLSAIAKVDDELRLGALVTHRMVERSALVRSAWPALADAFGAVASPRVRMRATVGGVLADADHASDPPAMLVALSAHVVVAGIHGTREIAADDLVVGFYETSLEPDELVVEVRIPGGDHRAVYRKFRSRSHEDRPCVGVAACRRADELRVVVGAVADRPQIFPQLCDTTAAPETIARAYAAAIDPIDDVSGSSSYRRRVIEAEVRRALEAIAA